MLALCAIVILVYIYVGLEFPCVCSVKCYVGIIIVEVTSKSPFHMQ